MAENYEKLLAETVITSFLMQIYKHYANKTKKVEKKYWNYEKYFYSN